MKTYKNFDTFKRRVSVKTDWADYFKLGGRMFTIYEYGGGWDKNDSCYVYFLNKRSNDLIRVEYFLNDYRFISAEYLAKYPCLWR